MTHIEFVDQTLRDGQQSLWGLRMRAYQAADALPHLDRTGFRVVDLTGPGMFTVLLREFADDPWSSTDFLVQGLPHNTVRCGMRSISVVGFAHTPDAIIDLWVQTLIRHGVRSFWIYDCLYDLGAMRRLADVISDAGGVAVPSVIYGLTDLHDDAFFARQAAEMASWPGVQSLYLEDAAGVLKPGRAATLLPAVRAATGNVPLELHCHNTTGLAPHNYIEGIKAGFTILHTASTPMANGPSLPSTESLIHIVEALGHTHGLDTSRFAPVAENFAWAARDAGYEPGVPNEYDPRVHNHQLPGGMTGTLKNQFLERGLRTCPRAQLGRVRLGHDAIEDVGIDGAGQGAVVADTYRPPAQREQRCRRGRRSDHGAAPADLHGRQHAGLLTHHEPPRLTCSRRCRYPGSAMTSREERR